MALRIKRKFIEDAAIDGLKLRLATGQAVKLLKSDGSTEVRLIELDEATNKTMLGGAVAALLSDVTTEAGLRESGDAAISGQIQTLIGSEAEARADGDVALSGRLDVLEGPDSQAGSVAKALKDAKDYVNDVIGISSTAVAGFASLAAQMVDGDAATGIITALGNVDERLDTLQGAESVTGSVAKALKDAKDYADGEVSAEATARSNADDDLSERLDSLEANVHKKQKFVIGASEISDGYVDLDFIAMESSIVAGIGRLMIHEGSGEDFTVSTVAGKSRITFVGNLISSSAEQLTEGDILYVKYVKV